MMTKFLGIKMESYMRASLISNLWGLTLVLGLAYAISGSIGTEVFKAVARDFSTTVMAISMTVVYGFLAVASLVESYRIGKNLQDIMEYNAELKGNN